LVALYPILCNQCEPAQLPVSAIPPKFSKINPFADGGRFIGAAILRRSRRTAMKEADPGDGARFHSIFAPG